MSDLAYLGATEALALFRARELSPVELLDAVLEQAALVEPQVNAIVLSLAEEARAQAVRAEQAYAAGTARPLEGIPVAVKEEAWIAGQPCRLGSRAVPGEIADSTAVFAQRIIDAGGIVHARTSTPEFSAAPVTWSKLWGATTNPWNPAFSPGGSSGGSAAALASGTTTLATGSDIGGSLRIPAAFSGVVGFKPPYGRVPEDAVYNLDHYCHEGPMARTVADCALLQNVIAGPHPSDVASLRPKLEIPEALPPAAGLRVAVSFDLGCYDVEPEIVRATEDAVDRLRDAGVTVEEVTLPWQREVITRAARIHFGSLLGAAIRQHCDPEVDDLSPYIRTVLEEADAVRKEDIVVGLELEAEIYLPLGELLERYDALVCPTMGVAGLPARWTPGDPVAEGTPDDWYDLMMTLPFNIASRCPVLSVPSGLGRDGLPVGLSVVGRTYDDVTAFRLAAAHEERLDWWDRPGFRPFSAVHS